MAFATTRASAKRRQQASGAIIERWRVTDSAGQTAAAGRWRVARMPRDGSCLYRAALSDDPDKPASDSAMRAMRRSVAKHLAELPPAERAALAAVEGNLTDHLVAQHQRLL